MVGSAYAVLLIKLILCLYAVNWLLYFLLDYNHRLITKLHFHGQQVNWLLDPIHQIH